MPVLATKYGNIHDQTNGTNELSASRDKRATHSASGAGRRRSAEACKPRPLVGEIISFGMSKVLKTKKN